MPRDIEEFLKMAAKRRQQQKQQGGGPRAQRPASPQPQQTPPTQQQRPQPARPQTRRPPIQPATEDEIIVLGSSTQKASDPYRQSVAEHVKSHIDTSSLGEHASHLGEEVGLADDKLEARLHSTFDHSVASLQGAGSVREVGSPEYQPTQIATELVAMLRDPKSIRQAIILNEVLTRPNFDD